MRVIIVYLVFLAIVCTGCSFTTAHNEVQEDTVKLTPVTGYFSKRNPYKLEVYSLDKRLFKDRKSVV